MRIQPPKSSPRWAPSLIVVLLISACSTAPPYNAPILVAPTAFEGSDGMQATAPDRQWWSSFRDPALDQLISAGLAQNLTVLQAIERIQEAKAKAGITASEAAPQIGLSTNLGMTDPTGGTSVSAAGASSNLSWMVDLFGRVASAKSGSSSALDAAYASADVARITLAAEVATAYVDLRYYQRRMALTRDSKAGRGKTAELVHSAFTSGSATKLETLQADQLVAIADAQLPALEVGYARAQNRLAALTGLSSAEVAATLRKGTSQPAPHFRASVGVPTDVLRHRPDVIVAERNLAAAFAEIGVARAELYPSLRLGGSVSISGLTGGAATTVRSFGPTLSLPLFNGGKTRNAINAAQSRANQALLAWQAAVQNAIEEIQDALAAYNRDGRNMAAQEHLLSLSQQTVELARSSYPLGQSDFLSLLEAERTLLEARSALAEANRARALNFIRLSTATADGVTSE